MGKSKSFLLFSIIIGVFVFVGIILSGQGQSVLAHVEDVEQHEIYLPLVKNDFVCSSNLPQIHPKIMIVAYNPWLPSVGKTLFEYESNFDPFQTSEQMRRDFCEVSNGFVDIQIVGHINRNEFPLMSNGLRMTESEYLQLRSERKTYWDIYPNAVIDMVDVVESDSLDQQIKNFGVDEIWMFLSWQMSGYESRMGGPGAFWVNGPTFEVDSGRAFVVMGFENAVGVPNSFHSFGHRVEFILDKAYGYGTDQYGTPWAQFRKHASSPSYWEPSAPIGVGDIHHPPNASRDYEYDNPSYVESSADDWFNYPNLTGTTSIIGSESWGYSDYGYYLWWLSHLPNADGVTPRSDNAPNELRQNNWWKYIFDFNNYTELIGNN